jgi:hypothetical protein
MGHYSIPGLLHPCAFLKALKQFIGENGNVIYSNVGIITRVEYNSNGALDCGIGIRGFVTSQLKLFIGDRRYPISTNAFIRHLYRSNDNKLLLYNQPKTLLPRITVENMSNDNFLNEFKFNESDKIKVKARTLDNYNSEDNDDDDHVNRKEYHRKQLLSWADGQRIPSYEDFNRRRRKRSLLTGDNKPIEPSSKKHRRTPHNVGGNIKKVTRKVYLDNKGKSYIKYDNIMIYLKK